MEVSYDCDKHYHIVCINFAKGILHRLWTVLNVIILFTFMPSSFFNNSVNHRKWGLSLGIMEAKGWRSHAIGTFLIHLMMLIHQKVDRSQISNSGRFNNTLIRYTIALDQIKLFKSGQYLHSTKNAIKRIVCDEPIGLEGVCFVKLSQETSVVRWTDHPDTTIAGDWDVKHQSK